MQFPIMRQAAAPIDRAMARIKGNVPFKNINFLYQDLGVRVEISPAAASKEVVERAYRVLMDEFTDEGWGYHTSFGDSFEGPPKAVTFDHPITLTRDSRHRPDRPDTFAVVVPSPDPGVRLTDEVVDRLVQEVADVARTELKTQQAKEEADRRG